MPTVVIYGFKIPFHSLWEKIGQKEKLVCDCSPSSDDYTFCPYCGSRKSIKNVKIYRSLITGDITTHRSIDNIVPCLHNYHMDLYDAHPRGFTDDPVYLYFTQPNCYLQTDSETPVNMNSVGEYSQEIQDWMCEYLGEDLWQKGKFGLWVFSVSDEPTPPEPPKPETRISDIKNYILN